MGTKGYIHRKRYYLEYVCREGGFPDELGVEILLDIPTEPEAFQKWLVETRKFLDEFKEDSNKYGDMVVRDEVDEEEELDDFMYMMDLDELSFGLWKAPMFRLDHMPPEDVFLRCIEGTDHYLQSTCRKDTPEEYRFTYSSPSPKPDEKMQTIYRNLRAEQPVVSVSRLLSRPEALSNREATRARLLEVTVSALMTQEAHVVQQASGLRDRDSLSERHIRCCSLLIQLAINPSFYITGSHAKRDVPPCPDTHEWWIRKHICVALTTHLDDENSLRDSVARLAERILAHEGPHITYGIAFDLLRIAIVRVNRLAKSFTHTEALSFTPSRYALSPSTPGIEALARLGDLSPSTEDDVAYYLHHYFVAHKHTSGASGARSRKRENASFRLGQLSAEIWARVAGFVEDGADLTNLALSSSKIARATLPLLKYPQIPTSRESTVILRSPCSRVFRPAERKSALARRKNSRGKDDDSDDDDDEDDENESMEGSDSDTEEDENSDEDSKPKGIIYDLTAAPFTIASNNVFCFATDHDEWCGWDNRQQEWHMIGDSDSPLEVRCKDVSFKFQRFVGKVIS